MESKNKMKCSICYQDYKNLIGIDYLEQYNLISTPYEINGKKFIIRLTLENSSINEKAVICQYCIFDKNIGIQKKVINYLHAAIK